MANERLCPKVIPPELLNMLSNPSCSFKASLGEKSQIKLELHEAAKESKLHLVFRPSH